MGIFGPSKAELEGRINDLESQLEDANEDRRELRDGVKDAVKTARQASRAVRGITDSIETVEDKSMLVETLDEPRIGWKATKNHIVKLYLPKGTRVVHPENSWGNNKKRCNKAIVVQLYEASNFTYGSLIPTTNLYDRSRYQDDFSYSVGHEVTPNTPLDTDLESECTSGIHFFCSKEEAIDWL